MDFLLEQFSLLFGEFIASTPERRDEIQRQLLKLSQEHPDLFADALLEFIGTCPDPKKTLEAASCLQMISWSSSKSGGFCPEMSFVEKLIKIFLDTDSVEVALELKNIIYLLDEADPNFSHPAILALLDERLPSAKMNIRVRIQAILILSQKYAQKELIEPFNRKYADLLTLQFSYYCKHSEETPIEPFAPFFELTSLIKVVRFSVLKGSFSPFQDKYHIWDESFRSLLKKILSNGFGIPIKGVIHIKGFFLFLHAFFDLQYTFLSLDHPFKDEYIQKYARGMIDSLEYLNRKPPLLVVISIYRFIYSSLMHPQIYHQPPGLVESMLGGCCAPTDKSGNHPSFDQPLVKKILFDFLDFDETFFAKSSENFWNYKYDFDFEDEQEEMPKRDLIISLTEKSNKYDDLLDIYTKNLREIQSLCINAAVTSELTQMKTELSYFGSLLNSSDEMAIERGLFYIGKFSHNSKFDPSFFDVDRLSRFALPPFNNHIRIMATCALFELYVNCYRNLACTSQIVEVVYSNIFDDDITLSYCSIRLLVAMGNSGQDLILSVVHKGFKKFIERVFVIIENVSLYTPLGLIVYCFDVCNISGMTEELYIFMEHLFKLGDTLRTIVLEAPCQEQAKEFPCYVKVLNMLLTKFRDNISVLDPFFDDFFFYFLFTSLPEVAELSQEQLGLVFYFDNFLDKIVNCVLSKRKSYLAAASFLDYYLRVKFQEIGNEKMNSIRILIANCDDPAIKNRLTIFFSTYEA
jgi:hypothetical protein